MYQLASVIVAAMNLDLTDLRMIDAIAAQGTLTAAAKRLSVSQPALSVRLARLEARLGTEIYRRLGRALAPTAAGELLQASARDVLARLEDTQNRIGALARTRHGRLRISTECYTSYRWLPRIVYRLAQRTSDLEIGIDAEATSDPLAALDADRLDVALVTEPGERPGRRAWPLFEDELFAVCRADHALAARRSIVASDLAAVPLVLYTGRDHPIVRLFLAPAGVAPRRIVEVQLTEAIVELVRAGQGIACLSGWAFAALGDTRDLVRLRLGRHGVRRTWYAVTHNGPLPAHTRRFIELARTLGPAVARPAVSRSAGPQRASM
jgi:LysR family transcriptional regulator, regulator for metE and metH